MTVYSTKSYVVRSYKPLPVHDPPPNRIKPIQGKEEMMARPFTHPFIAPTPESWAAFAGKTAIKVGISALAAYFLPTAATAVAATPVVYT